jgi:tetratricopeptide (TPR) repeat protein
MAAGAMQVRSLLESAIAYQRAGRLADAVKTCKEILSAHPNDFDAIYLLAMLHAQQAAFPSAVDMFRRAVRLKPHFVDARYNLALAMNLAGEHDAALKHYQRVLKGDPTHINAINNYAGTLAKLGRFQEAIQQYGKLTALKPDHAEGHYNLSLSLTELGRFDEALESAQRATAISPRYAEAHFSCGVALDALNRLDEAISSYDTAIAFKPDYVDAHCNRSILLLLRGDYCRGWSEMEWRKKRSPADYNRFDKPLWLGDADIAKRSVLVHWEKGLGDSIQFCRFIPVLLELGANVLFMPQRSLRALMSSLSAEVQIIDDRAPLPQFDYHCPLMSLPLAFRTTLESIPRNVPYLSADPGRVEKWREALKGPGFKIGISWHGNPILSQLGKSAPLSQFEHLSKLPNVRLISLQKNEGSEQIASRPVGMNVETLGDAFDAREDAFLDTAAVMKNLDLVIAIDTSIAHLAGALGVPTWVALQQVPDWRWLTDRSDSPWYPTMRLFRQTVRGDWDGVFRSIEGALVEEIASRHNAGA